MTRFARAKGSKASNERVCEDATPWEEMKNQMLQKKTDLQDEIKRKEAEQMRNLNYQNFLKEREENLSSQTEWAEFPTNNETKQGKKPKKRKLDISENELDSGIDTKIETSNKKKKKKSKNSTVTQDATQSNKGNEKNAKKNSEKIESNIQNEKEGDASGDEAPLEVSSKRINSEPEIKPTKMKKKKLKIVLDKESQNGSWKGVEAVEGDVVPSNETKPKNTPKKIDLDSLTETEKKKVLKKQERRKKQVEKKKLKKLQLREEKEKNNISNSESSQKNPKIEQYKKPWGKNINADSNISNSNQTENFQGTPNEKKFNQNRKPWEKKTDANRTPTKSKMKLKDGEFKRRKDFQPNKIMVNGKEVDLEYYDGFPIKKEDAQNLKKLRKEMISKGLPRSEIERTLKLERRKAEKALTREKKKVCFNCRKFGHNLSECPDVSNRNNNELVDTSGTGICFKCGSTEHTSFVCRVVQGQNFKFATCFICKEQGHISRQCPDNARGLYPKGGACKVCGDVTHLKKDCPQFQVHQEKEQEKFRVESFGGGNPEDFDEGNNGGKNFGAPIVKQNKIIKF